MMAAANIRNTFWAEAIANAAYTRNRSPTSALQNMTPFEAWWGHKPSVKHLRTFGCIAYAHIAKGKRRKLDSKTDKCIFLGYSTCLKAYRIYNVARKMTFVRRNVTFNETDLVREGEAQLERLKPGVHTNDFTTIHGRPASIHTAPAEDNTSNQPSTPQALCEYGRGDRES